MNVDEQIINFNIPQPKAMKKVAKQAAQDAFEYASAQMAFGEGAGTRRRLIRAAVEAKSVNLPGYQEAFTRALRNQDMAQHAKNAKKLRKTLDRSKAIERNVRGLSTGNKQSLTTGVMIAATVAVYAHQNGYDKVALDYSKKQYKKAQRWAKQKKSELRGTKLRKV